ncbi:bifunctional 3-dehydroquinate dehydratase/shikimate dehydrogenase, chloroplastic-like isoform X2 [Nymphaea colorata]|uniref:bifunctional 3-dehydroquinate dehydratase/shikimate dehydrogenase, chloroplastic-like isoform X2 n=1 Tax=Nymphaea colorata TaxID=210225 RepID=UPI00129D86BE|nr:bifunctional 3-dehydroquinate dehydratase/shikimate dehydrogenase, chloroplastic-like isoform X2 [Nymphaea colorata]
MARNATLLCVPLHASSVEQTLYQIDKAKAGGADLVEIRLDLLENFQPHQDLEILLKDKKLPVLVTYRPKWEGGHFEGSEYERLETLRLAMNFGADYVDVELEAANDFISSVSGKKPENLKVIVSSHNYQSTPSFEDLRVLIARLVATGADIVKIATTAIDIKDVAHIFQAMMHCQIPVIGYVMGEKGLISRLLCPKFGGYFTYGILEANKQSAPWEPTLRDLLDLYNIRWVGPDTQVFGVIGNPIGHSKGPIVYNTTFKHVGYNGIYVHLLVDDLAVFLNTFAAPDFPAFSCGIPHKEAAVLCCDEVEPVAKCIGAVNTIVRRPRDGKLIGYNTDYYAAISAIEDGLRGSTAKCNIVNSPLEGKLLVVIGAGGAGKALAYGAKVKGARVVITDLISDRAKNFASSVGADNITMAELEDFHPEEGMILANATPVGMQPNIQETPIPKHALRYYALVFDAVYTPRNTRLLREAEESGAVPVSGMEMFVRQARGQFKHFTGLPAPENLMRNILTKI